MNKDLRFYFFLFLAKGFSLPARRVSHPFVPVRPFRRSIPKAPAAAAAGECTAQAKFSRLRGFFTHATPRLPSTAAAEYSSRRVLCGRRRYIRRLIALLPSHKRRYILLARDTHTPRTRTSIRVDALFHHPPPTTVFAHTHTHTLFFSHPRFFVLQKKNLPFVCTLTVFARDAFFSREAKREAVLQWQKRGSLSLRRIFHSTDIGPRCDLFLKGGRGVGGYLVIS